MTEYDFSPEAFEAHIHKQQQIARWVDKTNRHPPRNPFTPATPAVQALALQRGYDSEDNYDDDDRRRHRRRESKDHKDRPRDMERNRDRERERQPDPTRPQQKRHRSASHSATTHRPEPSRTYTVPPPLPIPQNSSPTSIYPTYQYPHPPRLTSPRDSRHSSRSSSTKVPSPTSYFPPPQVPYSAPPYKQMPLPPPVRSQTTPAYGYPNDKYGYSTPYWPKGVSGYPAKPVDLANAPQLPHSAYQTKQPPLLKRLFMGLTGGNKQQSRRVPRRKRSSSF
ncbi:hypothetical protein GALMADRAFT_221656 [Galerina marginata CBS 339.88]|uniref:Uncharacterized protein n=1 Tax=Galerina marginata (strain CBS 339.88) TaxID=685588 RepID=A0A067TEY0_GALM3|nr:hypothetical protein GALMADRAFT_221656 [Galerina marginata CBS 339.88]